MGSVENGKIYMEQCGKSDEDGIVRHVCAARERKTSSVEVEAAMLDEYGMIGDIHYQTKKSAVSLLPYEKSLEYFAGERKKLIAGRFGENLLVEGLDWSNMQKGVRLRTGTILLEIERVDASCPASRAYDGFMVCSPMEPYFVFCKVLAGGRVKKNQKISIVE